jgi:hypothetical protein
MVYCLLEITKSPDFIEHFAKSAGLNIWDWFAAIIAFVSLLVAALSLIIAVKTLKSQRKTQKNTTPVINIEIQKMLWKKLIIKLYINLMKMYSLSLQLEKENYGKKPEEYYIKGFCIEPDEYIHEELFYSDELRFKSAHRVKDNIEHYNLFFTHFAAYINGHPISADITNRMFAQINFMLSDALSGYLSAFREVNIVLNGHERFAKEDLDGDIYEDLAQNYKTNIEDIINNLLDTVKDKNLELTPQEMYVKEDAFVAFFEKYGKGKYADFLMKYFECSNKYVIYLLKNGFYLVD